MMKRLLCVALVLATLLASLMSFLDWRANPAGLFHGEQGTNWSVVGETAWTWWWPSALVLSLIGLALARLLRPKST